jgi:hypothetical protein
MAIFNLSGACNAILLLTTRPKSGLFSRFNYDMDFALASSAPLQPRETSNSDSTIGVEEYNLGRLPQGGTGNGMPDL